MRIALAQMLSTPDPDESFGRVEALCRRAAAAGADLVVLPEFAAGKLPVMSAESVALAEPVDGPFVTRLRALAGQLGLGVVLGMLERDRRTAAVHNCVVAVAADGGLLGAYRKVHLYDAFGRRESDVVTPGPLDGLVRFTVAGVRVGLLTCYDLRFPEIARLHSEAGVDLLAYPSNWVPGPVKLDHWATLLAARAVENLAYVAGVTQPPPSGVGSSRLVDPLGRQVAALGSEPDGLVVAEVDPGLVRTARAENPSLDNRRYAVVPGPVR